MGERSGYRRDTKPKRPREQRRDAAEDVCWKLLILMGIGQLEDVPMRLRGLLADPLQKWADLNPTMADRPAGKQGEPRRLALSEESRTDA